MEVNLFDLINLRRSNMDNNMSIITGDSGTEKTLIAKSDILNIFLNTNDYIIIIDTNNEYREFISCLNGNIIDVIDDTYSLTRKVELKKNNRVTLFTIQSTNDMTINSVIEVINNVINRSSSDKKIWLFIDTIDVLTRYKKFLEFISKSYKYFDSMNIVLTIIIQDKVCLNNLISLIKWGYILFCKQNLSKEQIKGLKENFKMDDEALKYIEKSRSGQGIVHMYRKNENYKFTIPIIGIKM